MLQCLDSLFEPSSLFYLLLQFKLLSFEKAAMIIVVQFFVHIRFDWLQVLWMRVCSHIIQHALQPFDFVGILLQ